jgi:PTS system mannose-specific IIB component/fructoselysine and glucoselysine-specific PTS system IIB component
MPIVLCRVDDRLVHGQVVVGWGRPLHVQRIVLVDDVVADSDWEQDLYRLATPPAIALEILSAADAAARLPALAADETRTLVVTGDLATAAALHAAAPALLPEINLGGIHHAPGRRERLPYLFLTDAEFAAAEALVQAGARVRAQDVPTAAAVDVEALR